MQSLQLFVSPLVQDLQGETQLKQLFPLKYFSAGQLRQASRVFGVEHVWQVLSHTGSHLIPLRTYSS